MSPANATSTSSLRDFDADQNQDLSRKKARLSEEDSAAEDTILVEACEPEDIGASLDTAIQIEDDESTMIPYSDQFSIRSSNADPISQLNRTYQDITSGKYYLESSIFLRLVGWLKAHIHETEHDSPEEWRLQYLDYDSEFFARLGHLALAMLNMSDLFEAGDLTKLPMRQAIPNFFLAISELSCRIVTLLPDLINSILARRDSAAQGTALAQPVELFWYLEVARRSLPAYSAMADAVSRANIDFNSAIPQNWRRLSKPDVLLAFGTIAKLLAGAMRQIKESWTMLSNVLKLFSHALCEKQYLRFPEGVFEEIMEVLKACVLPMICAKHPGALPENFHRDSIQVGFDCLYSFVRDHDHAQAVQLYHRFIKSDEESIVPDGVADSAVSETLATISNNDAEVLAALFASSWKLQAALSYLRSDIMNVRNIGLTELIADLTDAFHQAKRQRDFDSVFIQHGVRFLRKNEVAKYIFSSDSHATLISESAPIITFLSSTATYTDQETDVIWRACSTSVEADFVQASFGVLANQLANLDFGHLLYILNKYSSTPIENLGAPAAEFLAEVVSRLENFQGSSVLQKSRLELALSLINILKHIDSAKPNGCSARMRHVLQQAVGRFAAQWSTAEDRREIYAKVIPELGRHSSASATAAEVLTILMQHAPAQKDAETILLMLPVSAAVDGVQAFVEGNKDRSTDISIINTVNMRLSYIVRLMSLDAEAPSEQTVKKLFDCMFGADALCEYARAAAWDKLRALRGMEHAPVAALDLWRTYMQKHVPSLPTELANPRLVELIFDYVHEDCKTGELASDFGLLLDHPLWEALVRFATTSADQQVIKYASHGMQNLLFGYPARSTNQGLRESAVRCQQKSVQHLVRLLQDEFDRYSKEPTPTKERYVLRTIDLLHAVLLGSRDHASAFAPAMKHDVVTLDSSDDEAERLSFTMQIYNAATQPQLLSVLATKTTTVAQLLACLPAKTGASAHRVIAAGREITGLTTRTLAEAGVQGSGVIQIRPRYKQDFDFEHLLMSAGPVEKEIVAHYDDLEALVDGPRAVAEKVVNFLEALHPSSKARSHVTSSTTPVEELFPKDRPARARFSIHVLKWHLRDCARLNLTDTRFLTRGIQVLTCVLMDSARHLIEPITGKLLACLKAFLQERPTSEDAQKCFQDGAAFAARMIDRLFEIKRVSQTNIVEAQPMAGDAYSALLLAGQVDPSIWQHFCADERTVALHVGLLLHPRMVFAEAIARPIRSLCQDSEVPKAVANVFWKIMLDCLPEALKTPIWSGTFFRLAPDVLQAADEVRTDEASARGLVNQLKETVEHYHHTESVNYLNRDFALNGLLTLLRDAVVILKGFKKPLELTGLSTMIAERLLFPNHMDPNSRSIVQFDSRAIAYDLMRLGLESAEDFERIVEATELITERSARQVRSKFPQTLPEWWRQSNQASGLTNLGMTCYMNSMLQQLFGNIQFRRFILDLPSDDAGKGGLLRPLQALFARMQCDINPYQDTSGLACALGVQVGNQEDVHDFYASLVSRLEDEMPDGASKTALSHFFTGQSVTQVKGECGHVSSQKEAFGDLSVTVKNKANLHESLDEFVQGEPMEGSNKYKCMKCDPQHGRLVDAMRRTCLEEVPDCLTVCLKRFTIGSKFLGEGKVNDRFDFPETIDMSVYKRTHLEAPDQPHEPDVFQLVGVIVHQGSLNLGHYWSYVRSPNPSNPDEGDWYYLEDTKTLYCPTGFDTIRQECFGGLRYPNGQERADNAYVLCYQRKKYVAQAHLVCERLCLPQSIPASLPRVPIPETPAMEIHEANGWRQMVAALFDTKFGEHVCWLLHRYAYFKQAKVVASDSESDTSGSEISEHALPNQHEATLGSLMINYVIRILLSDPDNESKLQQTGSAMTAALTACPRLAFHMLDVFTRDRFGFETTLKNGDAKVMHMVFDLILTCIGLVRQHDPSDYLGMIDRLLDVHSKLLEDFADLNPRLWADMLKFPLWVAKQGSQETAMVLEKGYFQYIIEVTWAFDGGEWARKHRRIVDLVRRDTFIDYDPLWYFLSELLSEHVDLVTVDLDVPIDTVRIETDRGWSLSEIERKALTITMASPPSRLQPWVLYTIAVPHSRPTTKNWSENGLGKLVGLLASDKASSTLKDMVHETLLWHYEDQEAPPKSLLIPTLHFAANTDDADCKDLLKHLGTALMAWDPQPEMFWFFRTVFAYAPCSIVDSVTEWGYTLLMDKRARFRNAAADWIVDHVFVEHPLADENFALEASRLRIARHLGNGLTNAVKTAYDREAARNGYEAAMHCLEALVRYLNKLLDGITEMKPRGVDLPPELVVEINEARRLLPPLMETLAPLADWESTELALPTRGMGGVRQSVEVDDSDDVDVTDDEFLDDLEDDELSQSL